MLAFSGPLPAQEFVGSAACAPCHREAYDAWQQSHHRHAMEVAGADSVLGDFNDARFDYFGHGSRFFTRDGRYFVATDNSVGRSETFRIAYTLGFYPLQQYLVEFPDGRLQALSISWDSRPQEDGGQRWYHLYPDEEIAPADPLHWTGAFQNWNSRCASCHTTDLAKNYSADTDTYDTRWAELGVGCEACHGAGSRHVRWAKGEKAIADEGLETHIRKIWAPRDGQLPIPRERSERLGGQLEVCGGCHSRREQLQHGDLAAGFFDNYGLTPLLDGLYYPDGQIREEVYVLGSFLQSKMHQNHVSCTNCHDPHSNRLRAQGNDLCLQCHDARTFQSTEHFFHAPESPGAQCVNCHMPARTYMGVDRRRDHSFRIPDPVASVELGVPNACTQCHTDRTDRWAADFIAKRTGRETLHYERAATIAAARNNDARAAPPLLALAEDSSQPAMLRAIALIESARFPSERELGTVRAALGSPEPLIRMNAVSALGFLPGERRFEYLQPLLTDAEKSVRMAVARQLIDVRPAQVPPAARTRLEALLGEYEATLRYNADMPETMSELGLFHAAQGDLPAAESALVHARKLAPHYLAAMLNLADVYRAEGRDDLGEPLLEEARSAYPDSGDASYALGLLYVRTGRTPASVALFERASRLAPANPLYTLVYAVALAESGKTPEAIAVLEDALRRFPDNAQIRDTLQTYRAR